MKRAMPVVVLAAFAQTGLVGVLGDLPAHAAFPGVNGKIAYQYGGYGGPGICPSIDVVNPDGSANQSLTPNCPAVSDPSWTADASKLVYAAQDSNQNPEIATLNPGTQVTNVITTGVTFTKDPSVNNDGSTVVFGGVRGGGVDTVDVYTVPIGGGTATKLTNSTQGEVNEEPQFSPDGTTIAWSHKAPMTTANEIWVMSATGQNQVSLTAGAAGNAEYPNWSPDGTKIAFASDRSGTWHIYVMGADGSNVVQVTNDSANDIQPAWSPDGTMIAFTRGCTSEDCNGYQENGDIYKVDVSNLASPGTPTAVVATATTESDPSWGVQGTASTGPHARTITLGMSKHGTYLVASGRLTATDGTLDCMGGVAVDLQRRTSTGWAGVVSVNTGSVSNGSAIFSVRITGRIGTYRAVAPEAFPTGQGGDDCSQATSTTVTITYTKHSRTITNFFVGKASGSYIAFVDDLRARDGLGGCAAYSPILLQRLSGSTWKTFSTTKTGRADPNGGAHFHKSVLTPHGTFRAVATQKLYGGLDLCLVAVSVSKRF